MSKKKPKIDEPFSPEQLERLESKGDKDVQLQRQKEGLFQRYTARRESKDLARQVRWKRRAGVAIVILVAILLILWLISWLFATVGDLVITVDKNAAKRGITISAHADGSEHRSQLNAAKVEEVTNISYRWLPSTLDLEADGSHNGRNYLAYTYYLTNNGIETIDLVSELKTVRAAKTADEAVRVMIYRNGEPTVYAKPNLEKDADGNPKAFEEIHKKVIPEDFTPPTAEEIAEAAKKQQAEVNVVETDEVIEIVPFVKNDTVFSENIEKFAPGETIKYTIVMWIEGDDPESVDDIRGGTVKLEWYISVLEKD